MLVAAAVCPHPPLLVPELAAGASGELAELRVACDAAMGSLGAAEAELLVVVGDAPSVGPFPESAWGSLAPYGVDVRVGRGPGPASLPLSLTIGRWLVERADISLPSVYFGVSADANADRCAQLGAALAERRSRVAFLAMGDASGRRSVKGPGYLDERAAPYDEAVAAALRTGDPAALLALDVALSAELLVAGRAAWQVLAGAAAGGSWEGSLMFDASPYGVTYLVAEWTSRPGRPSARLGQVPT